MEQFGESRVLFPSELLEHKLWWNGPSCSSCQNNSRSHPNNFLKEICLALTVQSTVPLIPLDRYSTFTRLKRVTAWIFRFLNNCRKSNLNKDSIVYSLMIPELVSAGICLSQLISFPEEVQMLKLNLEIRRVVSPFLHYFMPQDCEISYSTVLGQTTNTENGSTSHGTCNTWFYIRKCRRYSVRTVNPPFWNLMCAFLYPYL